MPTVQIWLSEEEYMNVISLKNDDEKVSEYIKRNIPVPPGNKNEQKSKPSPIIEAS